VLEAGSIVCSASICVALIRFQFMEVVVQQVSFNLGSSQRKAPVSGRLQSAEGSSQRKAQANRPEESFTVGLSSFRLTVRMSRRAVLKMSRSPSDLIST